MTKLQKCFMTLLEENENSPFAKEAVVEEVSVERLDHLGVVAGVIKDFGSIEMI